MPRDERFVKANEKLQYASDKDDQDYERDVWEPTPEIFERFMTRDYQLACGNLKIAMANYGYPVSFRELKDAMLHAPETIERILADKLASGQITEKDGRYAWVK